MTYVFPQMAGLYAALGPWVEALLRVVVGLCLIPHGLRAGYGFFPNPGAPVKSLKMFIEVLNRSGYRPGTLWGPVIIATELVGGPMLALGLFTRLVSIPIEILLIMSIVEHAKDGWFWNTLGVEYPLIWSAAVLYFLVSGGGEISLDALIGWQF
ncbi:MAG: DoxX family protein [Xanthobacteraceae bacterium]